MSRKTRKLIWSVPLVAALAVAGALAIFAALAPGAALAHDAPGAPTGLTATADPDGTITLKWTASTTGGAPTHYRIDYLSNGTGRIWKALPTDGDITGTTYVDMELGDDTGRDYRVFAMNSHGTSPVSAVAGATIPGGGVPGDVITFGTPGKVGATQLNLSWTAPAKDGGKPITSYRIHMATTSGAIDVAGTDPTTPAPDLATATTAVIDTGSAATTYSVMGLRANTEWYFVVYARNKNGPSANPSPVRHQITGSAVKPGAPTGLVAVYVVADTDTLLYWLAPANDGGSNVTGYRVEVRKKGKNWPNATELATSNGDLNTALAASDGNGAINVAPAAAVIDATHGDPNADDTFEYQVRAINGSAADGNEMRSDPSVHVSAKATANNAPSGPQNLIQDTNQPNGRMKINMVWSEPDTPDPGSGYRIDYSTDAGVNWMALEPNNNFTDFRYSHESDELRPGASYSYRVFNIKAGITGQASNILTTNAANAAAPDAPTDLKATVKNGGQIDLTWKAPKDDGGAAITKYQLHVTSGATDPDGNATVPETAADLCVGNVDTAIETKSDDTSYSLMGLCAQTRYNIGIKTVNALAADNVSSALSNVANVVTDTMSKPGDPMGLVAESARDNNLTSGTKRGVLLIWNAPPEPYGGAITEYEIDWKLADSTEWSGLVTLTGPIGNNRLSTYYTHEDEPAVDEKRDYRVKAVANPATAATDKISSEWVEVGYDLSDTPMHTHVAASGTIPDQTVTVDTTETVNAAMYFSENTGATYEAESDMPMYATAMADENTGMVTITGVAVGTANITVTATSGAVEAEQEFMVTVEAADTTPMAPSGVMAEVVTDDRPEGTVYNVKVTWTDGANAEAHGVLLFTSDFSLTDHIARGLGGSHTFENVAAGSYIAVVVVLDAQGGLVTDANGDYLYAGAESTVMVQP